jgi:hypothetical protein
MKYLMMTVLLSVVTAPAWAQEPGDAPEHGVARISMMSGDVTVRRGDSGEDVAAEVNAPLVALDHVFTNQGSRAELQFDSANFLRLAPDSEVRLAELADRDYLVQLSAGTLTFRVLDNSDAQAEISTSNISIRPRQKGTYRITVHDDGNTEVTVRSGEAEIYVGGKSDRLRAGQTLLVNGDASDPERNYVRAIPRDDWDRWNETRDRDHNRSDSYKYVNRHVHGAEDLYGYGRWVYDSPYGWVWAPNVTVGWAPYRVGRWVWVNFYGWTWVSGDPWGWAPYHYGRWYHTPGYGWVWYPGEPRVRYYWRPALVVFFGWGNNVGWVPLAPREVYRPWYGPSRTVVVNNTTVVNNINVVNTYRNAHFVSGRNGVTSVGSGDFGRRNITINSFVIAKNHDLEHTNNAGHWLPKEPSRENRQFSNRVASAHKTSHPDVDRPFVSHPDRGNHDSNQVRGEGRPESRGDDRGNARVQPNSNNGRRGIDSSRNEQERGRQPENNRRRGNDSAASQDARVQPNTDSGRRGNDSRRTETVTFPRNEQGRVPRSEVNRGRADASEPRVQSNSSPSSLRRTDETQRGGIVAPRNERPQQQEAGRGRNNDFVRAPVEARRESPQEPRAGSSRPSEASRRSEPAVRNAPDSAPPATAHPSREQSRGRSAPQSSSKSRQKTEEDSSDSGDRGRGRDGR